MILSQALRMARERERERLTRAERQKIDIERVVEYELKQAFDRHDMKKKHLVVKRFRNHK